MFNCVERGNATSLPYATYGRLTVRQTDRAVALRGWKKQMLSCNEVDRVRNMTQSKTRGLRPLESRCPRPTGVPLRENPGNLLKDEKANGGR